MVVPTRELVRQWRRELERLLVGTLHLRVVIGQLGDGYKNSLATCDVLVATAQSACRYEMLPPGSAGLLVADEVHHYGADTWSGVLEDGFGRRPGLTATYEGVPADPVGDFIRAVSRLAQTGGAAAQDARFYLHNFTKRREVLATTSSKRVRLQGLAPAIRAAERAILFTQTKEAARGCVSDLRAMGIAADLLTSDLEAMEREKVFAEFEEGDSEVLAAPKLLDEGIDVPEADLAIVLAASRSRRQMIQRMGRVIRPKEDGRMARLAVLFVDGTFEDPTSSDEGFLSLMTDAALEVRSFPPGIHASGIVSYLNDWVPDT